MPAIDRLEGFRTGWSRSLPPDAGAGSGEKNRAVRVDVRGRDRAPQMAKAGRRLLDGLKGPRLKYGLRRDHTWMHLAGTRR